MIFRFSELINEDPGLAHLVFSEPTEYLPRFDDAAIWAHVCLLSFLPNAFDRNSIDYVSGSFDYTTRILD